MLDISEVKKGEETVVKLSGLLVASECELLRKRIRDMIAEGATGLRIDMAGVSSIDSAGIGLLAATHNSVSRIGGKLVVENVAEQMYQFLVKLRLNNHFEILMANG